MISSRPWTTNQIPASTASAVTEATGTAVTTIPAARLTMPKKIHQPRPSRGPPEAPSMSADRPWTIQLMPMTSPMMATVRCRWRISSTPVTISSRPEMPSQTRRRPAALNILIRWKIPAAISRMPSSTAITVSEPLG